MTNVFWNSMSISQHTIDMCINILADTFEMIISLPVTWLWYYSVMEVLNFYFFKFYGCLLWVMVDQCIDCWKTEVNRKAVS